MDRIRLEPINKDGSLDGSRVEVMITGQGIYSLTDEAPDRPLVFTTIITPVNMFRWSGFTTIDKKKAEEYSEESINIQLRFEFLSNEDYKLLKSYSNYWKLWINGEWYTYDCFCYISNVNIVKGGYRAIFVCEGIRPRGEWGGELVI